jgi:adenylate cyclase
MRAPSELAALVTAWREGNHAHLSAAEYARLGRLLIDDHALFDAVELLRTGLDRWSGDHGLRQALALAWSRSEAPAEAVEILSGLVAEGAQDPETIGLLAAAKKRLGLAAGRPGAGDLESARELYATIFRSQREVWHGINAATLAALLGKDELARDTAREVMALCRNQLAEPGAGQDYWLAATMAEAALVLEDLAAAEEWARRAHGLVDGRFGMLNSTRRQLAALCDQRGRDRRIIDQWLPMPAVVLFAGHMVDLPSRPTPRFPPGTCPAVGRTIRSWLDDRRVGFGFSSAACGGDILFQEALADIGAERCVVLPFPTEAFRQTSVDRDGTDTWGRRFETVMATAARMVCASRTPLRDHALSFEYANQLILGLARSRALQLDAPLEALVVWDGKPGDSGGGTAHVVATCRSLGITVHRIDPQSPAPSHCSAPVLSSTPMLFPQASVLSSAPAALDRSLGAVLFADAVGFSRLSDGEMPLFVDCFQGRIAALVDRYGRQRVPVRETWGDGLFFQFPTLEDAALFALDLTEMVNGTDWQALGFSERLRLRVALHFGPMYPTRDRITGRPAVCGAHIAQAARLEPKTPPGQVYATEAFAARAALQGHPSFRCTFDRQLEFDKHYGTFPSFVVTREKKVPATKSG